MRKKSEPGIVGTIGSPPAPRDDQMLDVLKEMIGTDLDREGVPPVPELESVTERDGVYTWRFTRPRRR